MSTVQLISIVLAFLFLIQIIILTAKNILQDQQSFMWLIFAVVAIIIAFTLPTWNHLANIIGVTYMPSLIFLLGFFVVLSLLIYHTVVISRQQEKIKTLSQEFAYVNKELTEIKENLIFKEQ